MKSTINYFLSIVIFTVLILLNYTTVQQSFRTGANDPQIQLAHDLAAKLNSGRSPDLLIPDDTIEIANSLATVTAVFSADGKRALSGSWDKTARQWDVGERKTLATYAEPTEKVHAVALTPDGKRGLTASYDRYSYEARAVGNTILRTNRRVTKAESSTEEDTAGAIGGRTA